MTSISKQLEAAYDRAIKYRLYRNQGDFKSKMQALELKGRRTKNGYIVNEAAEQWLYWLATDFYLG